MNTEAFIEARIVEAEASATEALELEKYGRAGEYAVEYQWVRFRRRPGGEAVLSSMFIPGAPKPEAVLRQGAALRALVAGHDRDDWFEFDDETTGSCTACSNYCPECRSLVRWPCGTLRTVAAIWTDHPDYPFET